MAETQAALAKAEAAVAALEGRSGSGRGEARGQERASRPSRPGSDGLWGKVRKSLKGD